MIKRCNHFLLGQLAFAIDAAFETVNLVFFVRRIAGMSLSGKISILLCCMSLCLSAYIVRSTVLAFRADPAREIYVVVESQLQALQQANFADAYGHASQAIKVRYDVDQFRGMVIAHYHPLMYANHIELGVVTHADGMAKLEAYLIDSRGAVTPCTYHFVRESGGWRISGVVIRPAWPSSYRLGGLRA